jgi:hypothetical protein
MRGNGYTVLDCEFYDPAIHGAEYGHGHGNDPNGVIAQKSCNMGTEQDCYNTLPSCVSDTPSEHTTVVSDSDAVRHVMCIDGVLN